MLKQQASTHRNWIERHELLHGEQATMHQSRDELLYLSPRSQDLETDSYLDEHLPDGGEASLLAAGIELEQHGISIFYPDENEKKAKKLKTEKKAKKLKTEKKAKKVKKEKKDQVQDRQGVGNSNEGVLDLDSYMSSVGPSKRQAHMTGMATNADGDKVLISKQMFI